MKKRILAIVLSIAMVLSFMPVSAFADGTATASTTEEIVFNLGANGSATHKDGSTDKTTYSETNGDYTLSITGGSKFYPSSYDAKGNSCIKLGSSSAAGKFTFTVPDDVTKVIINIGKYKANTTKIQVNNVSYTLTKASNNGEYDAIEVDTSATKTVNLTTVSGGYRAMMNSIVYVVETSGGSDVECEHNYDSVVTDPTCTEGGFTTYTCSLCGDTYKDNVTAATGHNFVAGEVVDPTLTEQGYTIYTCTGCGDTENRDFTDPTGGVVEKEIEFQLGANGSASHADGSTDKATYSETNGDYTLSITGGSKFYPSSRDQKGNGAIKLGSSSAAGKFTFTVPDNVKKVIINIAGYKANTAKITVNGASYTISTLSNNGDYTAIEIDTSATKTVTFTTVSGGYRAMMDSIIFVATEVADTSCEHNYVKETTTAPTCTEAGLYTYTCSKCDDSYTETVNALGHNYVADETVDPTETEIGYTNSTCSNCSDTIKTNLKSPTGPAMPDGFEEIVFDFGANGSASHYDGSDIGTSKEFTVGDYGLKLESASKVYSGARDELGNSALKLGTGSVVATFSFTVPSKVKTVIIRIAGYKDDDIKFTINGVEHTVSLMSNNGTYMPIVIDTTETKTITLTTTKTGYRAMIDSITYWASTACEHTYESVTTDPTCTEAGKIVYTCSKCGESYEETIASTGHAYDSVVTAPTCTAVGYTTHTCANCGHTYKDSETAVIDHSYNAVVTAPTCTAGGYTTYTCSACGDTYKGNETQAVDHSYNSVTTAPTCTEAGKTVYTCFECGDSYEEEIVSTGHAYDSVITSPTCTEAGFTTHTCANCGDTYITDEVAATGHSYDDGVDVEVTEQDTGHTVFTCTACGDKYYENVIAPLSGKVSGVEAYQVSDTMSLKIEWNVISGAKKYIAYVYDSEGTCVKTAQTYTNSITYGLMEAGDYTVVVIAKVGEKWFDASIADQITVNIASEQSAPVISSTDSSSVTLTWDAIDGAIKYYVKVEAEGYKRVYTTTVNTITITGLEAATAYKVSVSAKLAQGEYTAYSETSSFETASESGITATVGTISKHSIEVSWSAVDGATKYYVKVEADGYKRVFTTSAITYVINNLEADTEYTISVCAKISTGKYTEYGQEIVAKTEPDSFDIKLSATSRADGIHLNWIDDDTTDKFYVKQVAEDGTVIALGNVTNETSYVFEKFQEGTFKFYVITRVKVNGKYEYVDSEIVEITVTAPKEVEVSNEQQLKDALAAAQVGEIVRITLTDDIATTIADDANVIFSVAKGTDVILNLNGKTITATLPDNEVSKSESVFYIGQDATLQVEGDGEVHATMGNNSSNLTTIFNNCGGSLLIVDGSYSLTLEEGKKCFIADIVDTNSTLGETTTTILGGDFATSDNIGNMFRNFANHKTEKCALTIRGGTFTSEFSSQYYPKAVIWNQAANTNTQGTGYVTVRGGTFNGIEVENDGHPRENVVITKTILLGVYGEVKYVETADEFIQAVAQGGYVQLKGDIDLSAADGEEITGNVISKNTRLDLAGYTISYTADYVSGMNGTQISAITVDNGATLVIGNGTINADSNYGIYVKDGNLVIENGSYSAHTSAVQVYNGTATILGGTFEGSETYLLNCIDSAYNSGAAEIIVKGGSFVGFNPADNAAETGGHTNFVAEGYVTYKANGSYVVTDSIDTISTVEELKAALNNGGEYVLLNDLDVDADDTMTVPAGVETIIYMNDNTIAGESDQTNDNRVMIDVRGNLTIDGGTVTYKHVGTDMGTSKMATVFNVTAGGVLNIEGAKVENLGGSYMNFCVHLNNWGEVTLNVNNSELTANYIAIRVFNSGYDMNNVSIYNSTVTGKFAFWVHNYIGDLDSSKHSDEAIDARLNFDIFNGTNTFASNAGKPYPVFYGFNTYVYFDENGNRVNTAFEELKAAIAQGGTVTLNQDVTVDSVIEIPADKTVVLNLNGYEIKTTQDSSSGKSAYAFENFGNLTINGGTIAARGIYNREGATLTINDATLIAQDSNGGACIWGTGSSSKVYLNNVTAIGYTGVVSSEGYVEINGGTYTCYSGIADDGTQLTSPTYAIRAYNGLKITDGTFTSRHGVIYVTSGDCVIDDGSYTIKFAAGTTSNVVYVGGDANLTINGGEFLSDNTSGKADSGAAVLVSGSNAVVTINNGTFVGMNGMVSGNANTKLYGGSYTTVFNYNHYGKLEPFVAEGYEIEVDGKINTVVEAGLSKDADGNYLIENVDDLVFFSDSVNSGTTYEGETVKLTTDLDLGGANFTPIGNTNGTYEFKGTFDGQENTISNYKVQSAFGTGLFGITNGATIKNLNVYNVIVESNHTAGSIVGYAKHTTVENCNAELVTVTVVPDKISDDPVEYDNGNHAGGVVAHAASSIVRNCSAKDVTILAYRDAGGVVGTVEGYDDAERYYGYVQNCTAENITITIDQLTYFYAVKAANAGGVVGRRAGDAVAVFVENNTETNVNIETNVAVNTFAGLKSALANGEKEINIAGPITLTGSLSATDVTFIGVTEDAAINFAGYNIGGSGSVTYQNLDLTTISLPNDGTNGERYGWYGGIDYLGHSVANYENCNITGVFTTYSATVNATGCTFNYYVQDGEEYYGMFLYSSGTVNANDCTFMYGDRAIKVYSEGPADFVLNLDDCKFVATEDYKLNKVLINIDSTYLNSVELNIGTIEIDEKLSTLDIHNATGNSKVTVSTLVDSADEIQDAINNGDGNITLEGDIDLGDLGGLIIPAP